eukprot:7674506-Pyramimonas_sp.AAC.1
MLYQRVMYHPCGGAPAELMPFPLASSPWKNAPQAPLYGPSDHEGEDDGTDARRLQRRRLLSTANQGYMVQDVGCKKTEMKVYFENMGAGSQVAKRVSPSEKQLVNCLNDIQDCDTDAYQAAQKGLCHADWPFGVSDPSSVPSLGVQVAGGPEDERAGDIHEYPGGDGSWQGRSGDARCCKQLNPSATAPLPRPFAHSSRHLRTSPQGPSALHSLSPAGKRRFKTCALVGNAGFLLNHK